MHKDTETKKKLLCCAKQEFLEKGYAKASLRSICRAAGVTTGALYFFFQDKDDLFCTIVSDVVTQVKSLILAHCEYEKRAIQGRESGDEGLDDAGSDDTEPCGTEREMDLARALVHEFYQSREEMLLVLNGAQGSSMENVLDDIITLIEVHCQLIMEAMCRKAGKPPVDRLLIHWVAHTQVDVFVYMVEHIEDREQALAFADKAMRFLLGGAYTMMGLTELSE